MRTRRKLSLFVILCSSISGIAVILIAFTVGSNFLKQRTQQTFQMETFFTLRELDRLFFERTSDVEVIARTLWPESGQLHEKEIEDIFYALRDYTKAYQSLAYVDENFIKRVDTNRIGIGEKVNWDLLLKAKNENNVVFDFYEDPETRTQVVSFVRRVLSKNGEPQGYVICNVPFSAVTRVTRLSKESSIFKVNNRLELIRNDGEIIYSTYRQEKKDPELARQVAASLAGTSGFNFVKGNNRLWSYGKAQSFYAMDNVNWYLVMSAKESDVYEPMKAALIILTLILMLFSFVFWFFVSNISRTLVRPLESASLAVEKFGQGDLAALQNMEMPDDDFGLMLKNLKRMGNQIRELMSERAHKVRMTVLGEIAENIAHEINNPLQVISIRLELIEKGLRQNASPEQIQSNLNVATQTVFRISKIVKGLKALSREGDADPFAPVSLQELLDNVLVLCQGTLRFNMVEMDMICDNPHFKLDCRTVQVLQVLINLVNNAYDAVKDQENRWIQIEAVVRETHVDFRVRNSGPKISSDLAEVVFNPFYTTKRAGEGTGLGLSISQKIAKEHRGSLFVDLTDEYTCFVLRLSSQMNERQLGLNH